MENKKYIVYIDESNILSQKGNSVYVILYIVYLNKDIVIKNIQDIEKALKNKVEETGVDLDILRVVMRRGMAAWKAGHRPGATQEQWGYARIASFVTKGPTYKSTDSDMAKIARDRGQL